MAVNDITGDTIATRVVTEAYRNNYDAIFGKKKTIVYQHDEDVSRMLDSNTQGFFDEKRYPVQQETQSPFNTINS